MGSALALHLAGLSFLALVAIVLAGKIGVDWASAAASSNRIEPTDRAELASLTTSAGSLRGLDKRVAKTEDQFDGFFSQRIPANYSSIASRLGELEVQSRVRLSHVQYSEGRPGIVLTEISVDSVLSGDYPQIMHFVNALERDRIFFVIRAMTLNGQQGGQVSLRLRFSTWLRPPQAAALELPTTVNAGPGSSARDGKE
jgi:hypothetical protein